MKDLTKGIVIAGAVTLICREFYVHGYNNGQADVVNKLLLMANVKEAVEKECKGES